MPTWRLDRQSKNDALRTSNQCDKYEFEEGIKLNSSLKTENEEKEMFISRTLAENESIKPNIEELEKRLKMNSKTIKITHRDIRRR